MKNIIQILEPIHIAFKAGQEILNVYNSETVRVELKHDESPLTIADKKAHHVIYTQLVNNYPHIPVISEEGELLDYAERSKWNAVWLVDPLDGTKEFIKRNGEFTVNIGLIENGTPVLGVIYCPVLDTMYFASSEIGSYKLTNCTENLQKIASENTLLTIARKLPFETTRESFAIAVSRSHFSGETEAYIQKMRVQHPHVELITSGSSIKMCLVAEGKVNVYPRLSYSMEWDTAAGEAIVKYSGGQVLDASTNEPMLYNKKHLKNPFHIVTRGDV
ncbi:3'(2'),5'-bisphosphate nucleotidase CysQ [Metasolibacillus meyeri]|uniref:3'(2'),5'-bisphosphate nucleotidase CysQ n=1 Tax=Metasolibacillus meyeri TaxID=1071052 RepID=UPI000D31EA0D|nr:3'(2'),5'-bisphosphate nucleotidase CysQ [Metasolibacillus meyeri]